MFNFEDALKLIPEQTIVCVGDLMLDDFVYGDDVRIHPHVFRSVFVREPALAEYQVNQTADGAELLLCPERPLDAEALAAGVTAALASAGLSGARVAARTVDSIPRLPSGKVKRFVPLA